MTLFIQTLFEDPGLYLAWVGIVAFSISLHEYSHAAAALHLGDDTAAEEGHLTLNPLVQMGPISIGMLLLIGIAWGMVPVDDRRLTARGAAGVALAGPAANLGLALGFGALAGAAAPLGAADGIVHFCYIGAMTNGALLILNLLPMPPLDGWQTLSALLPDLRRKVEPHLGMLSWACLVIIIMTPVLGWIWGSGRTIAHMAMQFGRALILPFAG